MGARALVTLSIALFACSPVEPLRSLVPSTPAQRFGHKTDYLRFEGVSRPVISTKIDAPTVLKVGRLPASRLFFAAAAPGELAEGLPARIPCQVRVTSLSRDDEPLACLEVPVGKRAWTAVEASIPPIEAGEFVLECDRDPRHPWVFWTAPVAAPHHSATDAPLVVLLSFDTLRADHVTGFGAPPDLTPNLARLGEEGVRLVNAAAEGTWTVPSHYALFYSRIYGFPTETKPLISLAQALADKGFFTVALTGGGFMSATWKFELGFDYFLEYPLGEDKLPRVFEDAEAWIAKLRNTPTFLFLHSYDVHEPPPVEKAASSGESGIVLFRPTPEEMPGVRDFYAGLVRRADAAIGPFVEVLRKESERRPVLLIALADHGQAFGEHGNYGHGYETGTLYDEVVRIPLIAWGPEVVRGGRVVERPLGLVDVAPTILGAVGVPPPPSMLGANLWPQWAGAHPPGGVAQPPPEVPGGVSQTSTGWALRSPAYKLIARSADGRESFELYDLVADPGERTDLSERKPDEVSRLSRALRERLADLRVPVPENGWPVCPYCEGHGGEAFWQESLSGEPPPGAKPPRGPTQEDLERLRALGYGAGP